MSAPNITAGEYLLRFDGVLVGNWVDSMLSIPRLVSKINIRQNFWSTSAIIQHQYPAYVWDHRFTIYAEQVSRESFLQWFVQGYAAMFALGGKSLTLSRENLPNGPEVQLVDFGICYLSESPVMREPTQQLQFAAGLSSMSFVGASDPTFTNIDS